MNNLDGKKAALGTLLSEKWFFRVPDYQRPFSWETEHFEDLITDLLNARKDQEYFLGTVVLHHRVANSQFDIVDGQQRLTSVLILLACLRDLVEDKQFKTNLQTKISSPKNVVDDIPEKVRLEVKDRQIFSELVVTEGGTTSKLKDDLPEPAKRYVNAVRVFRERLTTRKQDEVQELIKFISQHCVVIYLATDKFEDAFRLFTIVNDRGKQLRRIDILKALNLAPDVITKDSVRNKIAQDWERIENDLGEAVFESVVLLLRLILLTAKPQGDLFTEFEDRIFAKGTVKKGEPFFNLVFEYAEIYRDVFVERDVVPATDAQHTRYRALIHIMDSEFIASEWRACLLAFAHKFKGKFFYEFCLRIEKVYLGQWVKGVRKDERFEEYAKVLKTIDNEKKPEAVLASITADETAIGAAAAGADVYNAGYGKYLLLRLEIAVAEHDRVHEFTATSVEHVLPQNPESTGNWAKTHDLTKIGEYVHSIGNLVLLSKSKNSKASRLDFEEKKRKYLESRVSDFPRSLQVLGVAEWTRAEIDKRTAEATKLILQDP